MDTARMVIQASQEAAKNEYDAEDEVHELLHKRFYLKTNSDLLAWNMI